MTPAYDVYFNLHKKLWSLRSRKDRKVHRHESIVSLTDVTFVVSEKGRQRVIAQGRKNVHAFARGTYFGTDSCFASAARRMYQYGRAIRVTYNPYRHPSFVNADTGTPVRSAAWVVMVVEDGRPTVYASMEGATPNSDT